MSVLRFLIPGYAAGAALGYAVAAGNGLLFGALAAWLGGAAFTLLFAFVWHRATGPERSRKTQTEDAAPSVNPEDAPAAQPQTR